LVFFTSCCTVFVTIPGQIGGFPAQHNSDDHPRKIIDLHNYSRDWLHYKLDRTTVMVGAPSMQAISTIPASAGASSSTWAPSGCSAPVVEEGSGLLSSADACEVGTSCLLCHLRHRYFSGGSWTVTPLSRSSHRVPGFFFPLVHGVGRRNIIRQLKIQLSACSTPWKVLDYTTRGTYLLGG
jgi:hypothetical protein